MQVGSGGWGYGCADEVRLAGIVGRAETDDLERTAASARARTVSTNLC